MNPGSDFGTARPYRQRKEEMELLQVDICSENSPSIALYADGSFCQEVGVGAWAFRIPAMNLEDAGSSEGHTTTRFEFLGVLHGLESLAATDTSGCPVHVFSDCESTVAAIIGSSSRPTRCLSPSAPQDQGTVAGSGCFACADNSPSALRKVLSEPRRGSNQSSDPPGEASVASVRT